MNAINLGVSHHCGEWWCTPSRDCQVPRAESQPVWKPSCGCRLCEWCGKKTKTKNAKNCEKKKAQAREVTAVRKLSFILEAKTADRKRALRRIDKLDCLFVKIER